MNNNVIGEVSFKFTPRFSQLIGRNLISNPIVAVAELVKNSYDADADNISVEFSNLLSGVSSLSIVDDGEGMSFNDIETKWMMVGTDNKVHSPLSPRGRRKLGEKGIGRFSVERLAHKVEIISKKIGDDFALSVSIDWDAYETSNAEFSQIKHNVIKIPSSVKSHGTTLIMRDLRDNWGVDELLNMQKELELLRPLDINEVSYKKYSFPSSDLAINLLAPEVLKTKKLINSRFILYSQAHLFGEIKGDNTAIVKVDIKSNISASKNTISEEFQLAPEDVDMSCGPICFEAFVFLKDKRLYRSLNISNKDMDDYLKSFCGVKIYRDGFRILPFGDTDDDWLELNAQRTSSPEFRIATYNTIGVVYITRDNNPNLQDVLSRENMYETSEYFALKKFVNLAFEKYTALQLSARKRKERKIKEEGQLALDDAKKSVSAFSHQISTLKQVALKANEIQTPTQQIAHAVEVAEKATKIISTAEDSLDKLRNAYNYYKKQTDFRSREMQIYRNIATLGISAAMFGHEALNYTVDSKIIVKDIFDDYKSIISSAASLNKLLTELQENLTLIDEKADFYRNYLRKEKQDRSRYVNIYAALIGLLSQHKNAFKAIDVSPQVLLDCNEEDIYLWAYEGDIDTVFTNLITNAYKALKKETGQKYLIFNLSSSDGIITIDTQNNGRVISKENRSRIFEPLFSTYSDGTGLGLTIVQDTLLQYQGSIVLSDDFPDTHFVITIPKHEAPKEN